MYVCMCKIGEGTIGLTFGNPKTQTLRLLRKKLDSSIPSYYQQQSSKHTATLKHNVYKLPNYGIWTLYLALCAVSEVKQFGKMMISQRLRQGWDNLAALGQDFGWPYV